MINKIQKRFKLLFSAAIICAITISSASIVGCSPKKSSEIDAENKEVSVEKVSENSNQAEGEKISEEVVSIEKSANNEDNKEIVSSQVKRKMIQ